MTEASDWRSALRRFGYDWRDSCENLWTSSQDLGNNEIAWGNERGITDPSAISLRSEWFAEAACGVMRVMEAAGVSPPLADEQHQTGPIHKAYWVLHEISDLIQRALVNSARLVFPHDPWDYLDVFQAAIDWPETVAPSRRDWTPPDGYVGTKTIEHDNRFRKKGKNPGPSTIQRWVERSEKEGRPVKIVRDPATHENHYPEAWVHEQVAGWKPRSA